MNNINNSNKFTNSYGEPVFKKAKYDGSSLPSSPLQQQDTEFLKQFPDAVIAGYLNLGKEDGWEEGHDPRLGSAFTRLIVSRFYEIAKSNSSTNTKVIERVIEGLSERSRFPLNSRVSYDSSVGGWQGHAISRLVGNLGSTYSATKPFFEILINSQRTSEDNENCTPFSISIYNNGNDLETRHQLLAPLKKAPVTIAHSSFYNLNRKSPSVFLRENQSKLGANSIRILNGLDYLEKVTMVAQKVGNCWIKQPMRCLLTSLYIELLTERPKLTNEQAWAEATALYKEIQKRSAIPYIQDLLTQWKQNTRNMDEARIDLMDQSARRELEKQKNH
jgi:hypothetical protein